MPDPMLRYPLVVTSHAVPIRVVKSDIVIVVVVVVVVDDDDVVLVVVLVLVVVVAVLVVVVVIVSWHVPDEHLPMNPFLAQIDPSAKATPLAKSLES